MEIEHSTIYKTRGNFIKLITGQAVSVFGTALLRFALSLYVLDITGRADLFATLFALSTLPVLFSPLGGAIADRFSRKKIMVGLDVANGIFSLFLLTSFFLDQKSMIIVSIAMMLFGFVGAMDTPVVTSIVPMIASPDKLESANGMLQGVQSLSGIVAPILGGFLYSLIGMDNILFVTTTVFFLTAILESRILVPKNESNYTGSLMKVLINDLKDGLHYTVSNSFIKKTLLISVGLNIVLAPLFVVGIPYILRVTMKLSTSLYGMGVGSIQFATILGALMIGAVLKRLKVTNFYLWILSISFLLIPIVISTTPMILQSGNNFAFFLFILCAVPLSACLSIVSIFSISKVQKITPAQHLGKVMSILLMIIQISSMIGQIIYGIGFEFFQEKVYVPILITFLFTLIIAIGSKFLYRNEAEK